MVEYSLTLAGNDNEERRPAGDEEHADDSSHVQVDEGGDEE